MTAQGHPAGRRGLETQGFPLSPFCIITPHMCFLGILHPGLLPAHSTSLFSPLPRQFGSPTGLTPAGSRNTATLRCGIDQEDPGSQTLPALCPDVAVTSELHPPSFLSDPTHLFLVIVKANTSPYIVLCTKKTVSFPGEPDCQLLEDCDNILILLKQLTATC